MLYFCTFLSCLVAVWQPTIKIWWRWWTTAHRFRQCCEFADSGSFYTKPCGRGVVGGTVLWDPTHLQHRHSGQRSVYVGVGREQSDIVRPTHTDHSPSLSFAEERFQWFQLSAENVRAQKPGWRAIQHVTMERICRDSFIRSRATHWVARRRCGPIRRSSSSSSSSSCLSSLLLWQLHDMASHTIPLHCIVVYRERIEITRSLIRCSRSSAMHCSLSHR